MLKEELLLERFKGKYSLEAIDKVERSLRIAKIHTKPAWLMNEEILVASGYKPEIRPRDVSPFSKKEILHLHNFIVTMGIEQ